MLITITYIVAAAMGQITFVWWHMLVTGLVDYLIVYTVINELTGPDKEPPSAEDLADE